LVNQNFICVATVRITVKRVISLLMNQTAQWQQLPKFNQINQYSI